MASTQAAPGVDKAGATAAFAASPIQGGPQPEAQEKTDAEKQEITNEQEHVHQQQQYQHTAALQRQVTPRAWGEQTGGEPVDVDRAMQEFALARQETRRSARSGGQRSGLAGGWGVGRAPTRGTQLGEDPQGQDVERAEGEKGQDEFDLEKWILTRQAQAQESGVDAAKPLGMIWRNVDVLAPSSGGGMFVKTLPKAIINTIYKDPWAVACKLVPALHKLEFWSANTGKVPLLQNHSGVLKAGEMLLVLGRPGSGCSTMLRAVTSNTPPPLERTGKISYGGFTPEEIQRKFRGEIIFVDEDDIHFPTMTVAQTLRFALMTKVPRSMMRLSGESRKEFIKSVRKLLLDMFGISHVSDTVVGDAAVRGVSGGERKRVTISEALATRASVVAWDNSTRGLDASTALDYARSLRIMTNLSRRTTLATLYQVSESIYDLFDRIAVVDAGRCIYFGPRQLARQYFHELGYFSPPRQSTADFLTACTDPDDVKFREGWEQRAPKTPEDRERAWMESDLRKQLEGEIGEYEADLERSEAAEAVKLRETVRSDKNKGVHKGSSFTVSYWEQVKACIYRQLLVKWGARFDLYIKFFTIISVSLMISSLFYKQPFDSTGTFTRGGVMLFASLFNGWLQLSEAYEAVAGRPMLARHRQFAFYRPSAVVVARALVDIPLLALQCVLSTVIIYFLTNLRVNAGAFFIFLIYTFLSAYNLTALYRMFAAFSPGFNEAIRFSVLGLNIIIVFVGYVIRRPQMNWMIFLSYINGISYAFEGYMGNEFKYPIQCAPAQIVPFGEERDVAYQTCNLQGAVPGSLTVSGEAYISTTFGYTQKHVGRNIGVLIAFTALYLIPTIIASEIMQFGGGGGGMTIFARTKHAKAKLAAAAPTAAGDTEAAAATQSPRSIESDDTRAHSSSNGKEAEKLAEHRGRSIEDRAIFTWKDLSLELDSGRKLLQNVDGYVRPGTMTALMGASGAGKTTLLTTLSQRTMFGSISGEVLVDGKPLGLGFQKGTGFVLQGDVHLATQTVREAIEFSALLRQPAETPREEKLADAERALRLLELEDLQDALIGVPGAGLGVERRKRVTIAVELAAKPDLLLFLDEPTSGLDSAGAASICRLLRRLAEEEGQAILCTIHQPSALLFESFDNLLLLKPGGATAYFGQIGEKRGRDSDKVRTYFEAHGGPSCAPDANVAEYMLEVVSNNKNNDWARVWQESPNRDELRKEIDSIKAERSQRPANQDSRELSEFSANAFTQIVEVTKRQLKDVWRDSAFAYGILFSNFVVGLVAGGAFAHLGYSPTEYQNRVFIAFLVLLQFPAVVNAIIAKFFEIRVLFEVREGPSKTYAWYALVTSFIISTAPIAIVASVIYFFPSFYIPYYKRSASVAGYFYLMVLLVNLFEILFAFMLAAASPTPLTAANLLPFMLPILFIVSGIIVPHSTMPNPWRDFVYYVNPITYYVKGQLGSVLHGEPVICGDSDTAFFNPPPNETCQSYAGAWVTQSGGYLTTPDATSNCGYCQYSNGDQYLATLNIDYNFRWQSFGIFLGFVIFNAVMSYGCYWYFRIRGYGLGLGYVTGKASAMYNAITRKSSQKSA